MIKLIVNFSAGCGQCKKLFPLVQKRLKEEGIKYDLVLTEYPGHAKILAEKAKKEGYRKIVVCGGDGTVSEIVNAIVGQNIALGIIPKGIGNDIARNLGIRENIASACHIIKNDKTRVMDVIKVNEDKYYVGVGGIGFDAGIVFFINHWKKFVPKIFIHLVYIWAIIIEIILCKSRKVRIKYDENNFTEEILMACFGNTESYARVIQIAPSTLIDDGLLDICIVKRINKLKIVYLFLKTFIKTKPFALPKVKIYRDIPGVKIYRAKKVYIKSDVPLSFHGDAEIISKTPLFLKVVPRVLKVIVP